MLLCRTSKWCTLENSAQYRVNICISESRVFDLLLLSISIAYNSYENLLYHCLHSYCVLANTAHKLFKCVTYAYNFFKLSNSPVNCFINCCGIVIVLKLC